MAPIHESIDHRAWRGARTHRLPTWTLVALVALCLTTALARPARAQSTPPNDSTRRDSVVRQPPVDAWGLVPIMAGLIASFVFAPSPIALFGGDSGATRMPFAHDHVDAFVSSGGIWSDSQTFARSADLQVVRRSAYAELEVERIDGARGLTYQAARGGWLYHARRNYVGGVTLGWQRVPGDRRQTGPELGVPLYIGNPRAEFRLDPTYVFAPGRVLWSFRSQFQTRLGGSPYFAGARLAFRSAYRITKDEQCFTSGSVALLAGVRLR